MNRGSKGSFQAHEDSFSGRQLYRALRPQQTVMFRMRCVTHGNRDSILSHREDGMERPIGFRSRTHSAAERNYSQWERETFSLVLGVLKFCQYLLGQSFTLVTDHKPLVGIFHPERPIPATAAARIQRWAPLRSAYSYNIEYKPGRSNVSAGGLSRLPVPESEERKFRG